jgi:branched-chain amino acid transport system permease protein
MPIFGGLYTIAGPIIGTILIKSIEEYLRVTFSYGHQIAYGLILVVVVLFMPEGLLGLWKKKIFPLFVRVRQ